MSTRFVSEQALISALNSLGYTDVEVHAEPTALFGYRGDKRSDRANVVVRRRFIGTASNDLGFIRLPSGEFEAIISDFDRRTLDETWMRRLSVAYGHATVAIFAEENGWSINEDQVEEKDGTIRVTLVR